MELHFLGTSSGSPSRSRNVAATAVSFERSKAWLLVDCGEGTQHQIMKSQLSPYHLAAICITHLHGDHCYGLPGLLAAMMVSGRKEPVDFIAPKAVIAFVHSTLSLTELVLPFDLRTHALEELQLSLRLEFCQLDVIALRHRVPSVAFKITETLIPRKLHLELLKAHGITSGPHYNQLQRGFDVDYQDARLRSAEYSYFSWQPRCVIICGDNEKPELLANHLAGVDVLVHEATFTHADLHKVGYHTGHSDAKRIAEFAHKYQLPHLVLFHFSVRYHAEGMLEPLKREAQRSFQGQLTLAEDGLILPIAKQLTK
ncbi:ribonuclease Z [Pseudoalteromonas fenneropenaei]|uniref:Ribonuclease Z n=1 Tax=Pseudoalteromonas fenneropenaei TaxID=1737459 RepID=A0ABV7CMN7_9GAMM